MGGPDGTHVSIKASPDRQAELVDLDPETFAPSAYVGRFGWVTVDLGRVEPLLLEDLIRDAWRRTAPKKLAATLERRDDDRGRRARPRPAQPSRMGRMGAGVRRERREAAGASARRRDMGRLGHPGVAAPPAAGRPRRQGHDRARLRDRLRVGVARPTRRPAGRDRQLRAAAGDRPPAPGGARPRVPAHPRQRRDGAAAGCVVRPRDLRVRGLDLGRPLSLGPRGVAAPPARAAS